MDGPPLHAAHHHTTCGRRGRTPKPPPRPAARPRCASPRPGHVQVQEQEQPSGCPERPPHRVHQPLLHEAGAAGQPGSGFWAGGASARDCVRPGAPGWVGSARGPPCTSARWRSSDGQFVPASPAQQATGALDRRASSPRAADREGDGEALHLCHPGRVEQLPSHGEAADPFWGGKPTAYERLVKPAQGGSLYGAA